MLLVYAFSQDCWNPRDTIRIFRCKTRNEKLIRLQKKNSFFFFKIVNLRESSDPFETIHQTPCNVAFNFASILHGIQNGIQIGIEVVDATSVVQAAFVAHTILCDDHCRIMIFFVNPHEQFVHSKWHRLFKRVNKISHHYYYLVLLFQTQVDILPTHRLNGRN